MPKRISVAERPELRIVVVTMDNHMASALERARLRLRSEMPGLVLDFHAAAEWDTAPASLSACKADIARADAIAKAAHEIADTLHLKVIAAWTSSGSTAFRLARERPNSTVIALTPNRATARQLTLVWGVHAVVTKDASDADDMAFRACKFAVREEFAEIGDRIIVVAGVPFGTPGATNMVRVAFVAKEHVDKA